MIMKHFLTFFKAPGSGSGFRIQIRIRIQKTPESGSETLVQSPVFFKTTISSSLTYLNSVPGAESLNLPLCQMICTFSKFPEKFNPARLIYLKDYIIWTPG